MSIDRRARGLILINTGNGKGKTTAAIGTAFRALGHGMRVGMIQFIKGKWKTGERKLGEQTPNLTWLTMGHGFTWESLDLDRDRKAAQAAWEIARTWLMDESYDLVVFDEITYIINYGFVALDQVCAALQARRSDLHVILTGRDAQAELISVADVVTEMQPLKHPYGDGVQAQKGIEF
ncbi:MAG: cob(I)yrinic acid a,c-diamide adenosyltransferase [Candidatus Binataceae bacterium]|nr:cob(I)yrinic acid a,c-diamide adenosyltransferase [Candidatus Binataceae bacterium]